MMYKTMRCAHLLLFLLVSLIVTAAGCSSSGSSTTVQTIAVTPVSATINAGETQQFAVVAVYTDGIVRTLTANIAWASADETIATVDATGLATGIAANGSATVRITATVNGESRSVPLTVVGSSVVLQSIEVTPAKASLAVGLTKQFAATGTYSDGTIATLTNNATWKSDAATVATIDSTGLATAVNAGTANITAIKSGITSSVATLSVTPIPLKSISLPYSGSVDTTASYYMVSGLTAGAGYTVTMTGLTANADLYIYPNGYFRSWTCYSQKSGTSNESCIAPANDAGELYIKVDGSKTLAGTPFTLGMASASAPVLTSTLPSSSMPYTGSVGTAMNYYKVTGLTAGTGYTVTMTPATADADLDVYSDVYFSAWLCGSWNSGVTPDACDATANATGELYVVVDGTYSGTGTNFTLNLAVATAPVLTAALAFPAGLPYNGSVGTTASYYRVSGLTAGTGYIVTMTALTDDADLYVYSNPYFSSWLCGTGSISGLNSESCAVIANPSGELYITVDGSFTKSGATFILNVNP